MQNRLLPVVQSRSPCILPLESLGGSPANRFAVGSIRRLEPPNIPIVALNRIPGQRDGVTGLAP
jgi:hypothetical protein